MVLLFVDEMFYERLHRLSYNRKFGYCLILWHMAWRNEVWYVTYDLKQWGACIGEVMVTEFYGRSPAVKMLALMKSEGFQPAGTETGPNRKTLSSDFSQTLPVLLGDVLKWISLRGSRLLKFWWIWPWKPPRSAFAKVGYRDLVLWQVTSSVRIQALLKFEMGKGGGVGGGVVGGEIYRSTDASLNQKTFPGVSFYTWCGWRNALVKFEEGMGWEILDPIEAYTCLAFKNLTRCQFSQKWVTVT